MPGCCAVFGCRSRFVRGGKHFYRFPKNELFKQLWVQFTRKGLDYEVKSCSAICEDHFEKNRVVTKKKGRLYLLKQTVPTIFYRDSKEGTQKVTVEFDSTNFVYVGEESVDLHRSLNTAEEEKSVVHERRQRVKELKSLCRFCFESQDDRFVAISKLQAYSIDPDEMLVNIGLDPQYNEVFSEILCEQCFQQIVSIDGYRKRCVKAQDEIIAEMQELDSKLQTVGNMSVEEHPWFKYDEILEEEEEEQEELEQSQIEIIEEHLDDNISYVGEDDEDFQEAYDPHEFETYKMEIQDDSKDFQHNFIKEDSMKDEVMDDIIEQTETDFDPDYDNAIEEDDETDEFNNSSHEFKDVYHIVDSDGIIKNPDRNTFSLRVYECFFCRLKFAGKKTFKAHDCPNKEVKCEVEGCDKSFNKLSGYNTHVVKVHGLLKTSKHFCPICKNVIMATENQFKLHCRQCNKESEKKDSDNPIECEICKKKCPNLKSYTVHKLFHDSRNLISKSVKNNNTSVISKGPVICELCGKEFTNTQGLRTHRKNVHRVGIPNDIVYQCDICSKLRPTKRSLFNHMRNVHRVREAPCTVCNKIFRTPALLQKHMMYHDETKRIHRCPMCPEKPGWFTAVALRRHQKCHHLGLKEYHCDNSYCESSFSSNSMLKQHKMNVHGVHPE